MALVGDTIHRAKTDSPISRSLMEENRNTLHVDLDTSVIPLNESNRVFINPGPVPSFHTFIYNNRIFMVRQNDYSYELNHKEGSDLVLYVS